MKKIWKLKKTSDDIVQHLSAEAELPPIIARLLANRGIQTAAEAHSFLNPIRQVIPSPFDFVEMQPAVDRILTAIQKNERVLIHGDYDVDGITSTCIMLETLADLGLEADYYLPNRLTEGYDLQMETIQRIKNDYDLLITVDCGTTSVEEIRAASQSGLDTIVTDHHDPGNERPPAIAVLNPIRPEETYPTKNLSGAGVAWKLACALRQATDTWLDEDEHLDLVALGTVADIVPLDGENRVLLSKGLERIRSTERPGLAALMDVARVIPSQIDSKDLGFRLGPHLNAAGRMETAEHALKLLLTHDEDEAVSLAQFLHTINAKRQSVEQKLFQEACGLIERNNLLQRSNRILVVTGPGWHRGVLGIVASRLVNHYGLPVFLLGLDGDVAFGSARSVEGANLIPLLEAVQPHTISCGGHSGAAGVKVHRDSLTQFESELYQAAEREWAEIEPPILWIDAKLPLEQIDDRLMKDLHRLQPFGSGNEEPLFYARASMSGYGAQVVGNDHLRISLSHPRGFINAIGFRQGGKLPSLNGGQVDLVFTCQYNEFRGQRTIDLHLKDIQPAPAQTQTSTVHTPPSPQPPAVMPKIQDKPAALDPVLKIVSKHFQWNRENLGRIFLYLKNAVNESHQINLQNAYLFAKMEKITKNEFDTVLTVFAELEFLSIRNGLIQFQETPQKRDLLESPTFRAVSAQANISERTP